MRVSAIVANYCSSNPTHKTSSKVNSRMQNSEVSFKVNPLKEIMEMGAAATVAIAAKEAAAAKAQNDDEDSRKIPFPTGESDVNPFPNDDWPDTAY